MKYLVYLDSRQSMLDQPSRCRFSLNQTIIGAKQYRVLSFTFANTLYNVPAGANQLVFNTVTVSLNPAFYTYSDLITAINAQLMASTGFKANLPNGTTAAVTLNANNTANWTIGTNVLQSGGLYPTFQLLPRVSYTANFTTLIFIAGPMAVALNSGALSGLDRYVTAGVPISQPFYIQQITSGYGQMESSEPALTLGYTGALSNQNIDTISVQLYDPQSWRELTEMSQWSILLEIVA